MRACEQGIHDKPYAAVFPPNPDNKIPKERRCIANCTDAGSDAVYHHDYRKYCYASLSAEDPLERNPTCEAMADGALWNLTLAGGRICTLKPRSLHRVINIIGLTRVDKDTFVGPIVQVSGS